jgi:hypothetical protein
MDADGRGNQEDHYKQSKLKLIAEERNIDVES